jgi:hypothetical protein
MTNITTPSVTWQSKAYRFFTLLGWILVLVALFIGAFSLAPTAANYFGANAKATRDAAAAGSDLLGQLKTLQSVARWLEPLIFLGVASFMVGISLEFSMIPALLKNRGTVMKACFPIIVQKGE